MLRAKSLTINTCYGVTGFPDLCIHLAPVLIVILILIPHPEICAHLCQSVAIIHNLLYYNMLCLSNG